MLTHMGDRHLIRSSGNLLLRRLRAADQALLEPFAETVSLDRDATIFHPDERLDALYFPASMLLSLEEPVASGKRVEVAVIGNEGLLGWPALLACDRTTHAAVVRLRSGTALRIGVEAMRAACERSPSLWQALLRFVHVVIVQMAHSIASHTHDPLDHRLARWVLMRHDRVVGDLLEVHHDEIADSLNVRRASVTDSLHLLEGDHLLRCNRGRILVRDRAALERFAGASYGAPEAQYRSLIAPFGKSLPDRIVA